MEIAGCGETAGRVETVGCVGTEVGCVQITERLRGAGCVGTVGRVAIAGCMEATPSVAILFDFCFVTLVPLSSMGNFYSSGFSC